MRKYILLICPLAFLWNCSTAQGNYSNIKAAEFKAWIDSLPNEIVLDVRTPGEWSSGIIADAELINWHDADFSTQVARLDTSRPILVYCAAGGRSAKAANKLIALGFQHVVNCQDGMRGWKREGFLTVAPK